jgi:hypothetical protein
MKEQFVPYELALKLKEKDFDKPCMYPFDKYFYMDTSYVEFIDWNEKYKNIDGFCSAPLWQQCLEWLEREHWVDFWAVPILTSNPKQYECFIMYRGKEISCEILDIRFFNSYNEARQTAIEKILTLI